ncbi:S8 family serine peptidase, partial [Candidatus Poribacteria bacterium]|nr:S8 family serine peptidase [Candidatus Poribacteria bacterium]
MIRKFLLFLCIILILLPVYVNCLNPSFSPNLIIVRFSSANNQQIQDFANDLGVYSFERVFPLNHHLSDVYSFTLSTNSDIEKIISTHKNNPIIKYIQPNYINYPCIETKAELDDLYYQDQWALQVIDIHEAWKTEKGNMDIVIAVTDTGVDYNHEDLKQRIWVNSGEIAGNGLDDDGNGYVDDIRGWDFTHSPSLPSDSDYLDRDNDPMDEDGHGTHVSGIVAALPGNGKGTAGVMWYCKIMPLRAGSKFLEDDDLAAAIVYAADNGAHIINMSWGSWNSSYIIRDALEYAYNKGCILVGAVGNANVPAIIYPALYEKVIAVGATDRWDEKASFSNYGIGLDIIAPGHKIFSTTIDDRYSDWSGTSMAAPMVSGIIGLMLSRRPALKADEVKYILKSTAEELDDPLLSNAGRINAAHALMSASSPLIADIIYPESESGADRHITIIGTAAGAKFQSYVLEYRQILNAKSITDFSDTDWKPINHLSQENKFNDVLGEWNTNHLEEGIYVIRLNVNGYEDIEYFDEVIFYVDHSSPEIFDLRAVSRIDGNKYRYYVTWRTDDLTTGELYYRLTGSDFKRITSESISSLHSIYLSDELPPGKYEYYIRSINAADIASLDDNSGDYYPMNIKSLYVPSDYLSIDIAGIPAIHPAKTSVDFNDNGVSEIVGMVSSKWDYDPIKIYERDSSGLYQEIYESEDEYFPWSIDDTDRDGLMEILGSNEEGTSLYESPSEGEFPTDKIWEAKGVWSMAIWDVDQDNQIDILTRHPDTNEIYVYENRGNNEYLRTTRLQNSTKGRNRLSTTASVSDFDGDGFMEIVAGDIDGDILIYENTDDDRYVNTWMSNVENSSVEYISSGDFDNDGMDEFIVGSRATGSAAQIKSASPLARQRWIYTVFDNVSPDTYQAVWSQEIAGLKSTSGVVTGDMDNDGTDEIIVIVTPNIYVFKYIEQGVFIPVWHNHANETSWPVIFDVDSDGKDELLFNQDNALTFARWDFSSVDRLQPPWGLKALPVSKSAVELRWNGSPESLYYRVYRSESQAGFKTVQEIYTNDSKGDNWQIIKEVNRPDRIYLLDTGLKQDITYEYYVTSVNSRGESPKSEITSATPNSRPELVSAIYIDPNTVHLVFNEPMGSNAQNESRYIISSENGDIFYPGSAVLNSQGIRVT